MTSEQLAPRPCAVPGCDRPKRARGLCNTHYERQRADDPLWARPIPVRLTHCTVPGCNRPHSAHGLCATHNVRRRKGGVRPDVPVASPIRHTVPGCWACGAGDVRPGPCQPWCIAKRVSVRESFSRERADDDSERAAIAS